MIYPFRMNKIYKEIKDAKPKVENGEKLFVVENLPDTPTENIDMLFAVLIFTSSHLKDAGITFPNKAFTSYLHITPTKENLEANLFTIQGINTVIGQEMVKFKSDKVLLKFQLIYEYGNDLPTIRLAFVDFSEYGDINLMTEAMLYPFFYPKYEQNFFSKERIKRIEEEDLDITFLRCLPNSKILELKKDSNNELVPIHFNDLNRL